MSVKFNGRPSNTVSAKLLCDTATGIIVGPHSCSFIGNPVIKRDTKLVVIGGPLAGRVLNNDYYDVELVEFELVIKDEK